MVDQGAAMSSIGEESRRHPGDLTVAYRAAFAAFETYLQERGTIVESEAAAGALHDLAVLFEQAAGDGIPIGSVVGDDPVGIAEALLANHVEAPRHTDLRVALIAAMDAIVGAAGVSASSP